MNGALARNVTDYRRRAFVALVATSPYDGEDPLEHWAGHEPLWEVFEDRDDLLRALQEYWLDLLSHHVYGAPAYPLGAERTRALYAELAKANPSLRAILSMHEDQPVIAEQVLQEHVLVARAAGNLDARASASTLSWRARDMLGTIPAQREGQGQAAAVW